MIPSVEVLAKQISNDLYKSRKMNKSNSENPVNALTICTSYKALFNWDLTDRDIREATKFLVENKVPIGSTLQGYYFVLFAKEWELTKAMLMPKFLSIKNKIDCINEMEKEMFAQEQGQLEIPLLKILDDKLELERV
jgi:hypothetical protein